MSKDHEISQAKIARAKLLLVELTPTTDDRASARLLEWVFKEDPLHAAEALEHVEKLAPGPMDVIRDKSGKPQPPMLVFLNFLLERNPGLSAELFQRQFLK